MKRISFNQFYYLLDQNKFDEDDKDTIYYVPKVNYNLYINNVKVNMIIHNYETRNIITAQFFIYGIQSHFKIETEIFNTEQLLEVRLEKFEEII